MPPVKNSPARTSSPAPAPAKPVSVPVPPTKAPTSVPAPVTKVPAPAIKSPSTVEAKPNAECCSKPGCCNGQRSPSYDEIATAAYFRWQRFGGDQASNWAEAERELREEMAKIGA